MEEHTGYLKEMYVMDYLQFPSMFEKYKTVDKADRYECRNDEPSRYPEPGYVCTGCGNSVVIPSVEASEQCDDGNTSNNDGCSST